MAAILPQESAETSKTRSKRKDGVSYCFFLPIVSCVFESDESLIVTFINPRRYCNAACVNLTAHPTPLCPLHCGRPGAPVPAAELTVNVK